MSRIKVAPLAEFPTDVGLRVEVGEHRVAVFRVGDIAYAPGMEPLSASPPAKR